jgi:hypothetical protein
MCHLLFAIYIEMFHCADITHLYGTFSAKFLENTELFLVFHEIEAYRVSKYLSNKFGALKL